MKQALDSPWAALLLGIAITAALYMLAARLVPHVAG